VLCGKLKVLAAAEHLAARCDGFALGKVHAADAAANHVFPVPAVTMRGGRMPGRALLGWRLAARFSAVAAEDQVDDRENGRDEKELGHAGSGIRSDPEGTDAKVGRGERIRTSDSCVPNAVLYQAELHPDGEWDF